MEEDVETKPVSGSTDTKVEPKEEDDQTQENAACTTDLYKPSQYPNFSRILSINPLSDVKNVSSLVEADSIQKTEDMDDDVVEASVCVCGEPSTKNLLDDDTQQLQVIRF